MLSTANFVLFNWFLQLFFFSRRFIQRFNMKQHIKTHRIELMAEQSAAAALSGFAQ